MHKPKVLYVDDEENNLIVFKSSFRRYYDIHLSKSGAEGLEILEENDIDVIITDQRMPGMTGVEFLQQLPEDLLAIRMVLTGFSDVAAIIDAINSGKVYRYITKPWDRDELKITIDNAIEALRLRKKNQLLIQELQQANEQLEQKVVDRTTALEKALTEINFQKEELETLNATKDKFFSIVAHDLRNPMSALAGFASMLSNYGEQMSPEEIKGFSEKLHQSIKNALSLVENLLTWASTQMNKINHVPKVVDINMLVNEAFSQLSGIADNKGIHMQKELSPDCWVYADEDHLRLVIRNLLTNAIKFTDKDGSIKVSTQTISSGKVEIQISDTGIGMSPEKLDSLFKIGQDQKSTGTAGEKGTGLGLILSREFIEKNGGSIRVNSTQGSGTTFFLHLEKYIEVQQPAKGL